MKRQAEKLVMAEDMWFFLKNNGNNTTDGQKRKEAVLEETGEN